MFVHTCTCIEIIDACIHVHRVLVYTCRIIDMYIHVHHDLYMYIMHLCMHVDMYIHTYACTSCTCVYM